MVQDSDRLAAYLEHLKARVRARQNRSTLKDREEDLAVLPGELATFCASQPRECLELVIRVLQQATVPELIQAVGDELLENLLNENSAVIHEEVMHYLRTNGRFRQAFACGEYSSVDPALISDWVKVFQDLGTTKQAERKSLWTIGSPST